MSTNNFSFGQLKSRVINLEVQHNTLTSICMVMAKRLKELEKKNLQHSSVEEKTKLPVKEEVRKIHLQRKEKKPKSVRYVEPSDSESESEEEVIVRRSKSKKKKKVVVVSDSSDSEQEEDQKVSPTPKKTTPPAKQKKEELPPSVEADTSDSEDN